MTLPDWYSAILMHPPPKRRGVRISKVLWPNTSSKFFRVRDAREEVIRQPSKRGFTQHLHRYEFGVVDLARVAAVGGLDEIQVAMDRVPRQNGADVLSRYERWIRLREKSGIQSRAGRGWGGSVKPARTPRISTPPAMSLLRRPR